MSPVDIVVLFLFLVFTAIGLYRGFIEEIFNLASLVGGIVGAFLSYKHVFTWLSFLNISGNSKTVLSFVISFFAIAITVFLSGKIVKKIVHMTPIGILDRVLGAALGILKIAVVVWIFMVTVNFLPACGVKTFFSNSQSYKIFTVIPLKLKVPKLNKKIEELKKYEKIKKKYEIDKTKKLLEKRA